MTKVIGLFSDQEEAGKAVAALTEAGLDDAEPYAVENWDQVSETEMAPVHAGHAASSVTIPPINSVLPNLNLSDEEEQFLMRSLKKGGVLVVVEPADDALGNAKEILEDAGGQVTMS